MKVHLSMDKLLLIIVWKICIMNYAKTDIFLKMHLLFNIWLYGCHTFFLASDYLTFLQSFSFPISSFYGQFSDYNVFLSWHSSKTSSFCSTSTQCWNYLEAHKICFFMHSSTACAKHPTHFPGSGHFSSCCWGKVEGWSLMILSCQITDFLKQNHPWICGNDHGKRSDTSSALLPSFSVNCYLIQKVEPVFYRQAFLKNRCF